MSSAAYVSWLLLHLRHIVIVLLRVRQLLRLQYPRSLLLHLRQAGWATRLLQLQRP